MTLTKRIPLAILCAALCASLLYVLTYVFDHKSITGPYDDIVQVPMHLLMINFACVLLILAGAFVSMLMSINFILGPPND